MSHEKYQNCIETCYDCATECTHCLNACLDEISLNELVKCIKLNNECATICRTAAAIMSGGNSFSGQLCELCADVCDACAEECEKHAHLEHCKLCAEVCRKCAEECREMVEFDH